MVENTGGNSGGSGGGLYFIVGILVAAVLVIGFVAFGGHFPSSSHSKVDVNLSSSAPAAPTAPGK
jgi:hypothetical protein